MSDAKGNLRVVAVAVSYHDGVVVLGLLRNVSDACRKIALLSGQAFKNSICDLMGIKTQVVLRRNIGGFVCLLLFHRVKEAELDFIASVGSSCHRTVCKCTDAGCTQCFPVRILVECRGGITGNQTEKTASDQIVADDFGNVLRRFAIAEKRLNSNWKLVCPDTLNVHKKLCKSRFGSCDSYQADGFKKYAAIQSQVTSDHTFLISINLTSTLS